MKTLQEHYNAIKNGKGNKAQFLKQARYMFPEYFNQYTNYDNAVSTLKSKQIISEAAGGVVGKGFDIYDWKKILAEETKSVEKETSKEVKDRQAHAFDNADMKNADNINFNEIMKGFYAEMKDPDNAKKTGDEIKAMVVKNLAKDPLHYTKTGEFGTKGVGYTDEAPALGTNTQPKSKNASVLGGRDEVNSDSDIVKNSLVGSTKKNVQDTLSNSEAKTSMPKKVKEMPDKGVQGVEKKIKLKEEEIKWSRTPLNEGTETLDYYLGVIESNNMSEDEARAFLEDQGLSNQSVNTVMNYAFPIKYDPEIPFQGMTEEEQKLRSLIQKIIKEELEGSKLSQAQSLAAEYGNAKYIDPSSVEYSNDNEDGSWSLTFTMEIPKKDVGNMDLEAADEYFYKQYKVDTYGGPGAQYSKAYTDTKDGGNEWIVKVKASGGYDI